MCFFALCRGISSPSSVVSRAIPTTNVWRDGRASICSQWTWFSTFSLRQSCLCSRIAIAISGVCKTIFAATLSDIFQMKVITMSSWYACWTSSCSPLYGELWQHFNPILCMSGFVVAVFLFLGAFRVVGTGLVPIDATIVYLTSFAVAFSFLFFFAAVGLTRRSILYSWCTSSYWPCMSTSTLGIGLATSRGLDDGCACLHLAALSWTPFSLMLLRTLPVEVAVIFIVDYLSLIHI